MIKKLDLVVTSILVGLIWTIQLVHYPSFNYIDSQTYKSFQSFHVNAITPLVAPLMIIEMLFYVLSLKFDFYLKKIHYIIIFTLLTTIWLCTAFVSVPLHNALQAGKDSILISKLVGTNWIRTFAWTLKLYLMIIWQKE
jgi:L-cystine uptake protein TcyP (sodium:dicarboxylate symporter family)